MDRNLVEKLITKKAHTNLQIRNLQEEHCSSKDHEKDVIESELEEKKEWLTFLEEVIDIVFTNNSNKD